MMKRFTILVVFAMLSCLCMPTAWAGPSVDNVKHLGSFAIEIDPGTGHGSVSAGHLLGARAGDLLGLGNVNIYFDLLGSSCVDCGQGGCAPGQTRTVTVSLEQNGTTSGIIDLAFANLSVGGSATLVSNSLSCSPGNPGTTCGEAIPTGGNVTADVTVELNSCGLFTVFFDLEGEELVAPASGSCPCFDEAALEAAPFGDPLGCQDSINGPFEYWGMARLPVPSTPPFAVIVRTPFQACTNLDASGSFQNVTPEQMSACACTVLEAAAARGVACPSLQPWNIDCSAETVAPANIKPRRGATRGTPVPDHFFFQRF